MISLNELKQIRREMPELFREQMDALNSYLELFDKDADFVGLDEPGALSEADVDQFHALKNALNALYDPKKSDEELGQALQTLKQLPAFLQKKAFPDEENSPSILERMQQREKSNPLCHEGGLSAQLAHAVRYLELDLSPELSVKKLGDHRKAWAFPALKNLPSRKDAIQNSWAGRFYQLTKPTGKTNTAKDVSVYEHKCSDNTWRRLAAAERMVAGKSNSLVKKDETLEDYAADMRKNSLAVMTMRNEYTVEELRRGHIADVAQRLDQTRRDFSFPSKQAEEDAKLRANHVLSKMQQMQGKAASSPEFTVLKNAVQRFVNATGNMAQRSADVLVAVENFTKGRKNVQRSPRAQECVNLALDALVSTVPNAVSNPHVTPLMDRFAAVRSRSNRLTLKDFGAFRTNPQDALLQRPDVARDPVQKALVEAMDQTHLGRIDPAHHKRMSELLRDRADELGPLPEFLQGEDRFKRDVSALLLEELLDHPEKIASYNDMNTLELDRIVQKRGVQMLNDTENKTLKNASL